MKLQEIEFKRDSFRLGPINFEFEKSGLYFIQGKNGSGKTSLMRILMQRLKASAGQIDCSSGQIGFLGAENFFLEGLDSHENFHFIQALAKKKSKLQLNDLPRRPLNQLSQGQRKLLELRILLSFEFDQYFLDEPFIHLDAAAKKDVEHLILNQSSRNLVLVSLHEDSQSFGSPKGVIRL